jgi:hypothetical protein
VNFVRNLLGSALTCALALGVAPGCKPAKPDGTNPPDGSSSKRQGKKRAGKGGDGGSADDGDGGDDGGAAAAAKCEAKVAEAPTPLFNEKVLIRPPVNVEIVEENPTYATTYASSGFVSACDATVDRMHIFVFESDAKKGLDKYLDEFIDVYLVKSGYKGGSRGDNYLSTKTDVHTSIEYPPEGGQPPTTLYVATARRFSNVFMIVYQTRPDEFPALQPSFKASAESLLVIPDDA